MVDSLSSIQTQKDMEKEANEVYWKNSLTRAFTYMREDRVQFTYSRPDTCLEKTLKNPRLTLGRSMDSM